MLKYAKKRFIDLYSIYKTQWYSYATIFRSVGIDKSVTLASNIRTYYCKTNKLQNVYTIGRGAGNNPTKRMENFKIKVVPFIINFSWSYAICNGQV